MTLVVIDASIAATWTLEDEKSTASRQLLAEIKRLTPITTSLFWYEYRNILVVNERRGRITQNQSPICLQNIQELAIREVELNDHLMVLSLARQHHLSAYDAAYLALAIASNAILATNDRKLAQAALQADVEVRTALPSRPEARA